MSDFTLEDCIKLATELHAGQFDKGGRPYIGHLQRTAERVRASGGTWVQEMAAWLHDSIEDTDADYQYLLGRGVPRPVVEIVFTLSHFKGVSNENYWAAIKEDEPARLVKQCDIYDNLDPIRMCYLTPEQQMKSRFKYADALRAIS